MWDWISNFFGSGGASNWMQTLSGLGNLGLGAWNAANPPSQPQSGIGPAPQPMQMPQYQPMQIDFQMPDMPQPQTPAFDPTSLARQTLASRSDMQGRGVYSGGAADPASLMNMLGVTDPEQIKQIMAYLQSQGNVGGTGSWT